jgi:hypothetical protein
MLPKAREKEKRLAPVEMAQSFLARRFAKMNMGRSKRHL